MSAQWERRYIRPGHPDDGSWFACDEQGVFSGGLARALYEEAVHVDPSRLGSLRLKVVCEAPEDASKVEEQLQEVVRRVAECSVDPAEYLAKMKAQEPKRLAMYATLLLSVMAGAKWYETMLESSAHSFVAVLGQDGSDDEQIAAWEGARMALRASALAYAASLGDASALERGELETLRRFRDGIVSLRTELTACSDLNLVKETIDALVAMSFPLKMERK